MAQVIFENLSLGSKDMKLPDCLLTGRERLREEVGDAGQQRRLCYE